MQKVLGLCVVTGALGEGEGKQDPAQSLLMAL